MHQGQCLCGSVKSQQQKILVMSVYAIVECVKNGMAAQALVLIVVTI